MKKVSLAILLLLVFCSVALAAAKDGPDGFRGINWGADLSEVAGMRKVRVGRYTEEWTKRNEKMKIGDLKCSSIVYTTFQNKLYGVQVYIETDDMKEMDMLLAILKEAYGTPDERKPMLAIFLRDYKWEFPNQIEITHLVSANDKNRRFSGSVHYLFTPIFHESLKHSSVESKKETEQKVKQGAKDL